MTELIAATASVATSDAFAMSGVGKIIAVLADDEYVKVLEEEPGGTYIDAVNENGVGIVITSKQPSRLFAGYGNYKVYKSLTASAVAVGFAS